MVQTDMYHVTKTFSNYDFLYIAVNSGCTQELSFLKISILILVMGLKESKNVPTLPILHHYQYITSQASNNHNVCYTKLNSGLEILT